MTAVDIDPVILDIAKKHFHFQEDSQLKVVIEDGLSYLRSAVQTGKHSVLWIILSFHISQKRLEIKPFSASAIKKFKVKHICAEIFCDVLSCKLWQQEIYSDLQWVRFKLACSVLNLLTTDLLRTWSCYTVAVLPRLGEMFWWHWLLKNMTSAVIV